MLELYIWIRKQRYEKHQAPSTDETRYKIARYDGQFCICDPSLREIPS